MTTEINWIDGPIQEYTPSCCDKDNQFCHSAVPSLKFFYLKKKKNQTKKNKKNNKIIVSFLSAKVSYSTILFQGSV